MIIKPTTWDGHAINDGSSYVAWIPDEANTVYNLADASVSEARRMGSYPAFADYWLSGKKFTLMIKLLGTWSTQIDELQKWFDTRQGTKVLVIKDGGDSDKQWYLSCKAIGMPRIVGQTAVVKLQASEPIWRSVSKQSVAWRVTASGDQKVFTALGNCEALPKLTIKPTDAKNNGFLYRRFVAIYSKTYSLTNYPVEITNGGLNTQALVTASKMQSNGNDLRVLVNGVEVDRWLDGMNTTTTKIWINGNFPQINLSGVFYELKAGIDADDLSLVIKNNDWPDSGILLIGTEVMTYSSKSVDVLADTATLGGLTRGANGTTAATHNAADKVYRIANDIWIVYGNSSLGAPSTDNGKKPMFELDHSTNTSWVYESFYSASQPNRTRQWQKQGISLYNRAYTANHDSEADPATDIGAAVSTATSATGWKFAGDGVRVAGWALTNGEKYRNGTAPNYNVWLVTATGYLSVATTISGPGSDTTWEAWSDTKSSLTTAYGVVFGIETSASRIGKMELADATITLHSDDVPAIALGSEIDAYQLQCTIENTTTGEEIRLNYTMTPNESLEVDCEGQTVTYLKDGSNAFAALGLDAPRQEWLRLAPGANTLKYTETGAAGVDVTVEWEDRHL